MTRLMVGGFIALIEARERPRNYLYRLGCAVNSVKMRLNPDEMKKKDCEVVMRSLSIKEV